MTTDQPKEWVGPRPADALILLLAGSMAEEAVCDHFLDSGWARDFEIRRIGAGRAGANNSDEIVPLIKASIHGDRKLVAENRTAIVRVYEALMERTRKAQAVTAVRPSHHLDR